MSNIGGIWYLDGRPVPEPEWGAFQAALNWHRPPLSGQWRDGALALCACTTPFTPEEVYERQPLHAREGSRVLVSFARLDNRDELCTRLGIPPPERPSLPDSELILRAYAKWGAGCTEHLTGAFAFALWDAAAQTLFCARDHGGFYPFYYHHQPGRRFAFATDVRALQTLPGVSRALDEVSLAFLILKNQIYRPFATLYADVCALPNAHTLAVSAGGVEPRRYWSYDPGRQLRFKTDEAYLEAFREVFTEAVRASLRSLKPAGTQLSGGLDSSAITGVAAALLRERGEVLHAYGLVPPDGFAGRQERPGKNVDDRAYMQDVARMHPNVRLHYVTGAGRSWLDGLDRLIAWGAPSLTGNIHRHWLEDIAETAHAQGLGAILVGDVGNMTISYGAPTYLYDLLRDGQWGALLREVGTLGRASPRSLASTLYTRLLRPMFEGTRDRRRIREERIGLAPIHPRFLAESGVEPWIARFAETDRESRRSYRNVMVKRLMLEPRPYAESIYWAYRYGLGVEHRDPTADRRVVEFCLSIPVTRFTRGGRSRLLVRDGLPDHVPASVRGRNDRGDQSPDWYLRLDAMRPDLYRLLDAFDASGLVRRVLDVGRMRALLDGLPSGTQPPSRVPYMNGLLKGAEIGFYLLHVESHGEHRTAPAAR